MPDSTRDANTRDSHGRAETPDLGAVTNPRPEFTRLSVNVNIETANFLRSYADRRGCTITEAVRRAVAVLKFVTDETDAGHRLIVGDREVHFVG